MIRFWSMYVYSTTVALSQRIESAQNESVPASAATGSARHNCRVVRVKIIAVKPRLTLAPIG